MCEPCRQALNLPAERSYLNKMKRRAGGFSNSGKSAPAPTLRIVQRDETGKPSLVGYDFADRSVAFPSRCNCRCAQNGHDPHNCTGERDLQIAGRPGSGAVDAKAKEFGMEPIPEMVSSMHEEVAATVRAVIAWLKGSTDEERLQIENELDGPGTGYTDQLKMLRDLMAERMPEQAKLAPYKDLKQNLNRLCKFRNDRVAHSWPVGGDWLTRMKRKNGQYITFTLTADEVAEHMDLAVALLSQLSFIPIYVTKPSNDRPEAVQRLIDWIEGEEA